jgi:cation:H+ antiporter
MLFELLFFLAGLGVLAWGSDFTIENAIKFSKESGINQMTVGFILIALSTSLPELTIGVVSSYYGEGTLSMGNIIGANIVNLTVVFGILMILGLKIHRHDIEDSILAFILVSIISLFLIILRFTDVAVGIFLFITFFIFSKSVLDKGVNIENEKGSAKEKWRTAVLTLAGIGVVLVSAHIVTGYALSIADQFSLSNTLIGATLLSLGTTMPELSVGIAALRRKNVDLAIGDGLGTIVANITIVLGVASIINPIIVDTLAVAGLAFLIFTCVFFVFLTTRVEFDKKTGVILLIMYIFYIIMMAKL